MVMEDFTFISAEDRKKMNENLFGDPVRRLFPILSQEDVDNSKEQIAVLDNADEIKENIKKIALREGYDIPEGWSIDSNFSDAVDTSMTNDSYFKVHNNECSLTEKSDSKDGEYILRTGKIFEAGSYPDKNFDITPEEMLGAISKFKPVDLDLEHIPTVLDGKLGKLEAIALGEDGWSLVGTVRLPKKVDELLGEDRKVSATWDRSTKTIKKLALVRNPRVKDAALMAAFAATELSKAFEKSSLKDDEKLFSTLEKLFEEDENFKDTYHGQYILQDIHDITARAGAICSEVTNSSDDSEFVSEDESKRIQQIHDSAVRGGAKCRFKDNNSNETYYSEMENTNMKDIKELLEKVETLISKADTSSPADTSDKDAGEDATASAVDNKEGSDRDVVSNGPSEREIELEALLRDKETEIDKLREKEFTMEAEKFADDLIAGNKAVPAEKDFLVAVFQRLKIDDAGDSVEIKFKDGDDSKSGNRIDVLKAWLESRPDYDFTKELSDTDEYFAVNSDGGKDDYLQEAEKLAKEYASKKKGGK